MKTYAGEFGWETSGMESYVFTVLFFFVPRFSVGWGHGHKYHNTWIFFHTVDFLFLSSSSPRNPSVKAPLLLVGICCVPQVCELNKG